MGSAPIPSAGTVIPTPGQPPPLQPGEWIPSASATVVSFEHSRLDPPAALYVQTGELLVVNVNALSGVTDTVQIAARLLLPEPPKTGQPDGTGSEQHPAFTPSAAAIAGVTPAAAAAAMLHHAARPASIQQLVMSVTVTGGTAQTLKLPLQEGFLLSVAAVSASASARGQTFVRCWLQQRAAITGGISAAMPLFADYVMQYAPVGWPLGRVQYPTEGPGYDSEITIANPGAGSDWTYIVPASSRVRIQSIGATLTTSATAGARIPRAQIKSVGGVVIWRAAGQASVAASLTAQVVASPGQVTTVVDTSTINLALPGTTILQAGETIGYATTGLLAGDAWTNIVLATEQWLDVV